MQTMKKLFLIPSGRFRGLSPARISLTRPETPQDRRSPPYFRNESYSGGLCQRISQTMIPTAISVATGDARADYMAWRGERQRTFTDNFDADDQLCGLVHGQLGVDLRNINYFLGNFRRPGRRGDSQSLRRRRTLLARLFLHEQGQDLRGRAVV